jgi:hypothetical protein
VTSPTVFKTVSKSHSHQHDKRVPADSRPTRRDDKTNDLPD